jgi:peroxiredoxin
MAHPIQSPRFGALAALALALALSPSARAEVRPGDPFPQLPAGAGRPAARVLLVDFWASWCAPCKSSFFSYDRLQADFGSRGLAIVAVSVDEDPAAYAAFVARMKPTFTTVMDPGQGLVEAVGVPAMPTSFLLDRSGKVRFMHAGFRGAETAGEIRREVEGLLEEPAR